MNQRYGVCNLSIIPLRAEPSDKSEMTSQLLFGDHFTVLETAGSWVHILTGYDEYEGWIDQKQFVEIDQPAFVSLHDLNNVLGLSTSHRVLKAAGNEQLHLLAGSNIPSLLDNFFHFRDTRYKLEGTVIKPERGLFRSAVADTARFYLNAPYLWGGRTLFGIDCSGFTQIVFRQFGIRLKRDAWQQAEQGELVGFLQEAQPGDLAFFDNDEGRITHVGIMMSNSEIIHASGRVKIDPIHNQGIFSTDLNRHSHKLRIIKRVHGQ